ncbi:MAG: hypothetical protein H6Q31_1773 [Bacteroidetes bacterium]|nr:hypothetical protein [Bacteroidota bacterium]
MRTLLRLLLLLLCTGLVLHQPAAAQGTGRALTLEGLDQSFTSGARSIAMGSTGAASGGDATALFVNPAALSLLTAPEIRLGGVFTITDSKQEQDWIPNRFYPNLSLLLEDMLAGIKEPDATEAQDKLQRPFDDLKPDWTRSRSVARPFLIAAALPVDIGDMKAVVGVGFHQSVDLDHFYQNNTILDPNLGLYRPQPLPVVTGQDSLLVRWYGYQRERIGTINGYTASASFVPLDNFSIGLSATYYRGSSDDVELTTTRGRMTFFYDSFRLDQAGDVWTVTGTSTWSGFTGSLGLHYRDTYFSVGGTVRLPFTIKREWERTLSIAYGPGSGTSGGTAVSVGGPAASGSDEISYPVTMTVGFTLTPSEALTFAADMSLRGTKDVEYAAAGAAAVSPWLQSNLVHLGAEYRANDWLSVRGGYHTAVQVFAPSGAGLIDEPARGSAYSAGVGLAFGTFGCDIAYELVDLEYQDKWETNVNTNSSNRHRILLETYVRF